MRRRTTRESFDTNVRCTLETFNTDPVRFSDPTVLPARLQSAANGNPSSFASPSRLTVLSAVSDLRRRRFTRSSGRKLRQPSSPQSNVLLIHVTDEQSNPMLDHIDTPPIVLSIKAIVSLPRLYCPLWNGGKAFYGHRVPTEMPSVTFVHPGPWSWTTLLLGLAKGQSGFSPSLPPFPHTRRAHACGSATRMPVCFSSRLHRSVSLHTSTVVVPRLLLTFLAFRYIYTHHPISSASRSLSITPFFASTAFRVVAFLIRCSPLFSLCLSSSMCMHLFSLLFVIWNLTSIARPLPCHSNLSPSSESMSLAMFDSSCTSMLYPLSIWKIPL